MEYLCVTLYYMYVLASIKITLDVWLLWVLSVKTKKNWKHLAANQNCLFLWLTITLICYNRIGEIHKQTQTLFFNHAVIGWKLSGGLNIKVVALLIS